MPTGGSPRREAQNSSENRSRLEGDKGHGEVVDPPAEHKLVSGPSDHAGLHITQL